MEPNPNKIKNLPISLVFGGQTACFISDIITLEKLCKIIVSGDTITINNGAPIIVGSRPNEKTGSKGWKATNKIKDYSSKKALEDIRAYKLAKKDDLVLKCKKKLPYVLISGEFLYRNSVSLKPNTYTALIGIDIDYDPKKNNNVNIDWKILKKVISNDPSTILCALSPRGEGIKAIMLLDFDDITAEIGSDNYIKQNDLYTICVYQKLEKEWGVKLDYSQGKLAQPFYLTYDNNGYINYDAIPKKIDFSYFKEKNNILKSENKYFSKLSGTTTNISIANKTNDKYLDIMFDIIDNDPIRKEQLELFLSKQGHQYHYDKGLLFVINKLNEKGRKYFYNIFKKYSSSNSIQPYLSSFPVFNEYLNNTWGQVEGYKIKTLKSFFENSNIPKLDHTYYQAQDMHDIYGGKYDHNIVVNDYITEKYDEIISKIKPGVNILKAPAGTAKSTSFERTVLDNKDKNIIVISVKKGLLDQQYNHYKKNIDISNNFSIYKNYNGVSPSFFNSTGNIIFSTINSLDKIINKLEYDLILFDEAHLLVDYSSIKEKDSRRYIEILKLIKKDIKQVYASATPEKFILSLYNLDFNYINVEVKNYKKSDINVIYTRNYIDKLNSLLKIGDNNLIYINDKKRGKEIAESISGTTKLLNTDTQYENEMVSIIDTEYLKTGITYIATCYISEGINIKNTEKFNIYCLDNHTTDIDNIYQLVNRFRRRNVEAYYLTSRPNEYKKAVNREYKKLIAEDPSLDTGVGYILVDGEKIKPRKYISYNNIEKFDFFKEFDEKYVQKKNIQDILNKENIKENISDYQYFCDNGKLINRFFIGYEVNKKGMKYIKTNLDYYQNFLGYYFEPNFRYCKNEEPDQIINKKVDDYVIELYKKNKDRLNFIYSSNATYLDDEKLFFEEYENILKRFCKQNGIVSYIRDYIIQNNIKMPDILKNDDNLIFKSVIEFNKEIFKIKADIIINDENIDKLGNFNTLENKEFNETVEWINNKISAEKYILSSDLKEYMDKNSLVYGQLWISKVTTHCKIVKGRKRIKNILYNIWK